MQKKESQVASATRLSILVYLHFQDEKVPGLEPFESPCVELELSTTVLFSPVVTFYVQDLSS
jgi:hypothetical protein